MDVLRKEARTLESEIDNKLTSYTKFGTSYAQNNFLRDDAASSSSDSASLLSGDHVSSALAQEIEQLLTRVCKMKY